MPLWEWIKQCLYDILVDLTNILSPLDQVVSDMVGVTFLTEYYIGLSDEVKQMLSLLYGYMILLLALKLCWQGCKVYVLWRDGESEVSPGNLLTNSVFALAVAIVFPTLNKIGAEIVMALTDDLTSIFHPSGSASNLFGQFGSLFVNSILGPSLVNALLMLLLALVFIITLICLCVQIGFRGASMLFYRLGVPFAAIGLVNSDGGMWKNYIQIYFQQLATITAQHVFIHLSLFLLTSSSVITFPKLFFSMIFLIISFKMPKILAPILANGGSGQGAYSAIMTARMLLGRR